MSFYIFNSLSICNSFSQNATIIDSLKNVLKHEKKDTSIINTLISLSSELSLISEYDNALYYSNNLALKFCDSILSLKSDAKILYLKGRVMEEIGMVNYSQGNHLYAIENFKSALKIYADLKKTRDVAIAYEDITNSYITIGDLSKAIENQRQGMKYAKLSKNSKTLGRSQNNLADIYAEKGETDSAISYYSQALNTFQKDKNNIGIAETYQNLGILYADIGNYKQAIEYDNKSIKIFEQMSDKIGLAQAYNSMGCRYGEQNNHDEAIKYFKKSLAIAEKISDKPSITYALKNIGVILKSKKEYSLSLFYLKKSLLVSKSIGDANQYGMALIAIGNTYKELNNLDSALLCFFEGYKIMVKTNDRKEIATALNDIGTIYVKQKKFKEAENYCFKSFQLSQELGFPKKILESTEQLCIIYENLKRFEDAYNMHQLLTKMSDSLYNKESSNALVNYETEKTMLQLKQKQTEKEAAINLTNQKKLEQKNYWIYGSAGLLLLVIVSSGAIYKISKQRQTEKSIILEQKLLRTQMNPHFIFNTLASIQNFIYKDKKDEAHNYVGKFAKLMRSILENSREEFVSMEKEIKTLEHYLSLNQLLLDNKFNFKIDVDENIDVEHTQIPPMLAQPFIENALKHGIQNKEDPGFIKIAFKQIDSKNIQFEVEDNGIGFTKVITAEAIEHKSFATTITQERLGNLYNNKNVVISISEVRNKLNEIIGTKTFFTIPYKS